MKQVQTFCFLPYTCNMCLLFNSVVKSASEQYIGHSESVSLAVPINKARLLPGFGSFKQQAHISSFHENFGDFKVF